MQALCMQYASAVQDWSVAVILAVCIGEGSQWNGQEETPDHLSGVSGECVSLWDCFPLLHVCACTRDRDYE